MSTPFEDFNLLPDWYEQRVVQHTWTRVWGVTLGCVVPAVIAGVVLTRLLVIAPAEDLSKKVKLAEAEVSQRQAALAARPEPKRARATGPRDPRETEPSQWGDLLELLAAMSGGKIGFRDVEVAIGPNHAVDVSIVGLAEDSQGVLRFAAEVERSGLFAPMNSPVITFDDATGSVRFEMSAKIQAVAAVGEESP